MKAFACIYTFLSSLLLSHLVIGGHQTLLPPLSQYPPQQLLETEKDQEKYMRHGSVSQLKIQRQHIH